MKKVGIMGGTFNPIHVGHLMLAENAYAYCGLDEVWFMPSANPPHKKDQVVLEYVHRSHMTELAIQNVPYFKKTDFETLRQENSYTAETLRLLKEIYPDTEFYFIMGADSLFQIETWYEPAMVMARATLLVAVRDHHSMEEMKKQIDYLTDKYNANICLMNMPEIGLSSNLIRNRVANHNTIRFFVPESVREYILKNSLYAGDVMENEIHN